MNFEGKSSVTTMGDQGQSAGNYVDDGDFKDQVLENQPQKNKKIQTEHAETGIDWISQLPDSLIVQILTLMPITDAFRTTILSKRWQYLWTSVDTLIFDIGETKCSDSSKVNKFISFTDNVLRLLSCAKIKKFSLCFGFCPGVFYSSKIDEWLEIVLKKKVEDLVLDVWHVHKQPYSLPQVLCNNSSVQNLKCKYCRISEDRVLNWPSLKSLRLGHLFLRDEQIEQIISSCPQLEFLKLYDFCGFHRLHITSPKCRTLHLKNHRHPMGDWGSMNDWGLFGDDCYFEISAPFVQHLKISGLFHHAEIRLGDLSSFVHAELTFCTHDHLHRLDQVTYKTTVINNFLVSLRCANELTVPSWLIEVISMLMLEKKDASLPLLDCKRLTINSWITEYSFLGIDNLLRSTPYLENLRILPESEYLGIKLIDAFVKYWDEDIDLLEDNYTSLQQSLFKGSLQNLKNVEVISESCWCSYGAGTPELPQLLKCLLEHAINLESLVITPIHWECKICSINESKMIEELLAFPKASNNAVVSYVDIPEE